MLSEKEAWAYLEQLWLNPIKDGRTQMFEGGEIELVSVFVFEKQCVALCNCISTMKWSLMIDLDTYKSMNRKIDIALGDEVYLAPCTVEGAMVRVAFCRRMHESL